GHGMEGHTDYLQYSVLFQVRDPQRLFRQLDEWEKERRLVGARIDQEQGILTGVIVQRVTGLTPEHAAQQAPRLGANLVMVGGVRRLWSVTREALDEVAGELREKVGPALSESAEHRGPPAFTYVPTEAMVFPVGAPDQPTAERRLREGAESFYEETWIHRPR